MNLNSFRVAFFLTTREIRHTSITANLLIIIVMTLTFLNLMVSRGILTGLPEGATSSFKNQYSGDILITKLPDNKYILREKTILDKVKNNEKIENFSFRYISRGFVKANYKDNISSKADPNQINAQITGVNFDSENDVTNLSNFLVKGEYIVDPNVSAVIVGSELLKKYLATDGVGNEALADVDVGDKLQINVNGQTEIVTVAGVIRTKVPAIDRRMYISEAVLSRLVLPTDFYLSEIAIKVNSNYHAKDVLSDLNDAGIGRYAKVELATDAQPKFIQDIKLTFEILGDIIGTVGLIVASITLFIIIFVNAITKRRYIGILKGIGITEFSIELSYVMQAAVYAVTGSIIGLFILYIYLVPYFLANPIDFPLANGVLSSNYQLTFARTLILLVVSLIAGYIPARLIVKQNTLDAILGR